jgi:hypothetical protein
VSAPVRVRDPWSFGGLLLVGAAAAVLSFSALADLARFCNITGTVPVFGFEFQLAWLLPLAVDVFAVTATRIWLRRRVSAEAIRFARGSAWSAIVATVVGNAYHGFLTGQGRIDVVIVAAAPAVALGALVHLAVLVGRSPDDEPDPKPSDPWAGLVDDVLAEPWHRAIREWIDQMPTAPRHPGEPADRPAPDRSEPDEVLAADLRSADADPGRNGRPLSRDEVIARYGVGARRAKRLRELADALDQRSETGRSADREPTGGQLDEPAGDVVDVVDEQLDGEPIGSGRGWSA